MELKLKELNYVDTMNFRTKFSVHSNFDYYTFYYRQKPFFLITTCVSLCFCLLKIALLNWSFFPSKYKSYHFSVIMFG